MRKNKEKQSVPKNALSFVDTGNCFAKANTNGDKTGFEMLAYSGGIIKDHWWWGDLIIDLQGMSFPKAKFPILQQHDVERKLGFVKKTKPTDELRFENITYLDNEDSAKFIKESQEGFPFEASIAAKPTEVIRLEKGAKATVNGRKLSGPITIWQKSTFREASVCVFGYDSKTSSKAFADDDTFDMDVEVISLDKNQEGGKEVMDKKELQEKHPELFKEVVDETTVTVKKEVESEFSKKEGDSKTALQKMSDAVTEMSNTIKDQGKKILTFEKNETIRSEKEKKETLKLEADTIFNDKIVELHIPKKYHSKIKKMVNHREFVKEGKLDTEAFSTAVDTELKDWAELADDSDNEEFDVDGFGRNHRKETFSKDNEEEDDAWVKDMTGFAQPEHKMFSKTTN